MTWRPLKHPLDVLPCTASICMRGRYPRLRLLVIFRAAEIDQPPKFLLRGNSVAVEIGEHDDHGRLRITAGSDKMLTGGGNSPVTTSWLWIDVPDTLMRTRREQAPVEIVDHADDWIEIALPVSWRVPLMVSGHQIFGRVA